MKANIASDKTQFDGHPLPKMSSRATMNNANAFV